MICVKEDKNWKKKKIYCKKKDEKFTNNKYHNYVEPCKVEWLNSSEESTYYVGRKNQFKYLTLTRCTYYFWFLGGVINGYFWDLRAFQWKFFPTTRKKSQNFSSFKDLTIDFSESRRDHNRIPIRPSWYY